MSSSGNANNGPKPADLETAADGQSQAHASPAILLQLIVTVYAKSRSRTEIPTPTGRRIPPTAAQAQLISSLKALLPNILSAQSVPQGNVTIQSEALTDDIFRLFTTFSSPTDPSTIVKPSQLRRHPEIVSYETTHGVEIIFDVFPIPASSSPSFASSLEPPSPAPHPIGLALFDMDSTLIDQEVIDELAATIGVSDAVSAITARAMNGEIDFATSLRERVSMLKGVEADVWELLKTRVTIAKGAKDLIKALKAKEGGCVTGVISGGFQPLAEWLKGELGLDYAFANHLITSPPSESHPIITPQLKRDTLVLLAERHAVPLSHTMAVGDGSNDLLMLGAAGLGLAWNAKTRVQEQAPMRLNGGSLIELLWLV